MQPEANHWWDMYRKGDKSAFEQIYFGHVNILYDYGLRISRDGALVEDCIQDLFTDLWAKRAIMGKVQSVKSYLLVCIKRRLIRKLGEAQRNHAHAEKAYYEQPLSFDPDFSDRISEEKLTHLSQAFAKLSDKQKEVIYLRFYSQLTHEEIAEVMSVQVKAIYKLMARAIQVLRVQIGSPTFTLFLFAILATQVLFCCFDSKF